MTIYQKVIAAYGILRSAINGRMSKYDVAHEFRDSATYAVGRLVIHDDKLYRCTTAHTGPWDANDFVQSTVDDAIIYEIDRAFLEASADFAEKTDIASEFSRTQRYDVDRLVVYENVLYRCSVTHPAGEWNEDHFVRATVDDVIAIKAFLSDLADEFADGTYSVGQLVKKDGKIYRCTTEHTGAWNGGADFVESAVSGALNLMATNIASLNSTIAQTALKSELGYSGKSYDIDVSENVGTIYVHDMEVAVLHLSYSAGSPSSINIDLPEVESEDDNGNFHAARCFIIVDTSKIDDEEHMPVIYVGSPADTVLWTVMRGYFQTKSLNFLSLTYAGRNVWHCDQQYAST